MSRSLQTEQVKLKLMHVMFDASEGASPTAQGFDRYGISSISKSTTGTFVIVFRKHFERAPRAIASVFGDQNRYAIVTALATDRVTVEVRRRDDQSLIDDGIVDLMILGSNNRFDV